MGVHWRGGALPQSDQTPLDLASGAQIRVLTELPQPDPSKLAKLREFARRFYRKHFTPLAADTFLDTKEYLDSRPYSDKKKKQMWKDWEENFGELKEEDYDFGIFVKDETYVKYSYARLINAPSDRAKLYFGPIINKIEEQLYKLPWFIKKVPVSERPAFIMKMFEQSNVNAVKADTDFESFECSFSRVIKDAIEMDFMDYMVQSLPGKEEYLENFKRWLRDEGIKLKNKFFSIVMEEASRFSGELTTSAFNGLTNLLVHLFWAEETDQTVQLVVEGDDGLACWERCPPSPDWYSSLGFRVKIGVHQDVETTSFCGQVFHKDDLAVMTDPHYVLAGTGWLPYKYFYHKRSTHMSLLRAKAWSMGYQYQACPILSSFAKYLLRMTRSYSVTSVLDKFDTYKREQLEEALDAGLPSLNKPIGNGSRLLMAELYGITVEQQRMYESYFDSCAVLQPIPAYSEGPDVWKQHMDDYVQETSVSKEDIENPVTEWPIQYPVELAYPLIARNKGMQSYIDKRVTIRKPAKAV